MLGVRAGDYDTIETDPSFVGDIEGAEGVSIFQGEFLLEPIHIAFNLNFPPDELPTFRALEAYDIEKIYIDKDSLESRGLSLDDLVIEPNVIEASAVEQMMEEQKNFFIF